MFLHSIRSFRTLPPGLIWNCYGAQLWLAKGKSFSWCTSNSATAVLSKPPIARKWDAWGRLVGFSTVQVDVSKDNLHICIRTCGGGCSWATPSTGTDPCAFDPGPGIRCGSSRPRRPVGSPWASTRETGISYHYPRLSCWCVRSVHHPPLFPRQWSPCPVFLAQVFSENTRLGIPLPKKPWGRGDYRTQWTNYARSTRRTLVNAVEMSALKINWSLGMSTCATRERVCRGSRYLKPKLASLVEAQQFSAPVWFSVGHSRFLTKPLLPVYSIPSKLEGLPNLTPHPIVLLNGMNIPTLWL